MNFFNTFDEDKLLRRVLPRLISALDAWRRGMPADESALMNQISSKFSKRGSQECDLGGSGKCLVSSEIVELHRRGKRQVDQYGSDLALTIEASGFTKTAFFQFKIAKEKKARVESKQIRDAKEVIEVFERAFVFTVDRKSALIRVESMFEIEKKLGKQDSQSFEITSWEGFSEWLLKWLRCQRGKPSNPNDGKKIEDLLKDFKRSESGNDHLDWDLPDKYLPAKSWLQATIESKTN